MAMMMKSLRKKLIMNDEECQIDIIKECDICGKKYKVEKTFTKSYEKYSHDYYCY